MSVPACRPTIRILLVGVLSLFAVLKNADAASVNGDAILAGKPPRLLSGFGFFDNLHLQRPAAGVFAYSLTSALFSDHARKYRYVHVPAGTMATYDPAEAFRFPEGTALIKTFAYPADMRKPDADIRLLETRVLLKQESGWKAWAYIWNENQTDAKLNIAGARLTVSSILPDGSALAFEYSVPNKNQCKGCHALGGKIVPIGPKARFLNGNHGYRTGPQNQISAWSKHGILKGAPEPGDAPRAPDWQDGTESLDARARAWLDINCAHCHRSGGPASNSGLFLTWDEADPVALGIGKRPVAAGRGSGGRSFDIDPGNPDGSILLHRVESIEPGVMMPELGRAVGQPQAVELLREWIVSLRR